MLLLPIGFLQPAAVVATGRLLDGYSPSMCWGLTKLLSAYSGACIRVRRSSDNVEADIGFSSGVLDQTALLAHTGSNNGFLSKVYDHSGNGKDFVQTTAANQPQIVSAGAVLLVRTGGRAGIAFAGAQSMAVPATTPSGNLSIIATARRTATVSSSVDVILDTANGATTGWTLNAGNGFGPLVDAGKARFYGDYGADTTAAWLDGTKQTGANPFTTATGAGQAAAFGATVATVTAASALSMGAYAGQFLTGAIRSAAVLPSILSDTAMAALTLAFHDEATA